MLRVQGISSKDFVAELGYVGSEEIVHRDNICLLTPAPGNASDVALPMQDNPQSGKSVCKFCRSLEAQGLLAMR